MCILRCAEWWCVLIPNMWGYLWLLMSCYLRGWAKMICDLKIMVFHWKVLHALARRHLYIQYNDAILPVEQDTLRRKCHLKTILSPQRDFVQWQDIIIMKWSTFSKSSYLDWAMSTRKPDNVTAANALATVASSQSTAVTLWWEMKVMC